MEGQVSGDGAAALFAEELIQLDAVCNMERYIAVQFRAHVCAREVDIRTAAYGNVHVSLMRRAASAAGDNSKITGLHADVLRARCGAVHGTACIQTVIREAPRGRHIVRDCEIMPVGIYPADGIGDVRQGKIGVHRHRRAAQPVFGLTVRRTDGARDIRELVLLGQLHIIIEHDRAAFLDGGRCRRPALIIRPVHHEGVFLDALGERQILANDAGPFAVLFRRRADVQLAACDIVDGNLERAGVLGAGFGRVGNGGTGQDVAVVYRVVDFSAVRRTVKRYRYLIRIRVGGFLRRDGERRLGSRQRLIQCRLHG